jgi:hypothetical protein
MKEFKGTKGKWVFSYDKYDDDYTIMGDSIIGNTMSGSDESKANALLISKAPEMLEMLEDLVKTWDFVNDKKYHNHDMEKARQLIKEATEL